MKLIVMNPTTEKPERPAEHVTIQLVEYGCIVSTIAPNANERQLAVYTDPVKMLREIALRLGMATRVQIEARGEAA